MGLQKEVRQLKQEVMEPRQISIEECASRDGSERE
jgi:hypothetical protein